MSQIVIKSKDIDRSKFTDEKLRKMKEHFPHLDDDTLARFLIARNNKLKLAVPLLQGAESWRSLHYPILKMDCLEILSKGIMKMRGVDKEGRPLLVVTSKLLNPKERDLEEMARAVIWWAEHAIRALPDDKSKYTILFDRTDAGLQNQDTEFTKFFTQVFQRMYPERLHMAIVYPSGVLFWTVWNIVKIFLDPVTRNKVKPCMYFYGVQEHIADEHIPVHMGGKCTYQFSPDDYQDPYPAEVIEKALQSRVPGAPLPSIKTEELPPFEGADDGDDDDA